MKIDINSMLYKVHASDIAAYRDFSEGPIKGEQAVYKELLNLKNDPDETTSLAMNDV